MSPAFSTSAMTFTDELHDADGIISIQVVGNSSDSGWTYEDMTDITGSTWTLNPGANDWIEGNGYYPKVTEQSCLSVVQGHNPLLKAAMSLMLRHRLL